MAFLYASCLACNSFLVFACSASCWAFVRLTFFVLKYDKTVFILPSGKLRLWALSLFESWTSPSVGYSPNVCKALSTSFLVPDSRYRFKAFWKAVKNEVFDVWHQKEFSAQRRSAESYEKRRILTINCLRQREGQTSNKMK